MLLTADSVLLYSPDTNTQNLSPTQFLRETLVSTRGAFFGVFMITQELVKDLFDYREDGNFIRKTAGIGKVAGSNHHSGYRYVTIQRKPSGVHRVVFLWHNGYLPKFVDHINGIKDDNRIENLRPCTQKENNHNRKANSNSTSDYKGVGWKVANSKWQADIKVGDNRMYLGLFTDEKDAAKAYDEKAREHHGTFARLNFPEGETV